MQLELETGRTHQIRVHLALRQDLPHPRKDLGVNVPRNIPKVGRDPPFNTMTVDLVALAVNIFNHPHSAGNCDLVPDRRRLHDCPQLFGPSMDTEFFIFLENRVELEVVNDPLTSHPDNQVATLRLLDLVGFHQVPQQGSVVILTDVTEVI